MTTPPLTELQRVVLLAVPAPPLRRSWEYVADQSDLYPRSVPPVLGALRRAGLVRPDGVSVRTWSLTKAGERVADELRREAGRQPMLTETGR